MEQVQRIVNGLLKAKLGDRWISLDRLCPEELWPMSFAASLRPVCDGDPRDGGLGLVEAKIGGVTTLYKSDWRSKNWLCVVQSNKMDYDVALEQVDKSLIDKDVLEKRIKSFKDDLTSGWVTTKASLMKQIEQNGLEATAVGQTIAIGKGDSTIRLDVDMGTLTGIVAVVVCGLWGEAREVLQFATLKDTRASLERFKSLGRCPGNVMDIRHAGLLFGWDSFPPNTRTWDGNRALSFERDNQSLVVEVHSSACERLTTLNRNKKEVKCVACSKVRSSKKRLWQELGTPSKTAHGLLGLVERELLSKKAELRELKKRPRKSGPTNENDNANGNAASGKVKKHV